MSSIIHNASVLYFCYKAECTIMTVFLVKSGKEQDTFPKYVNKIRYKITVYCVTCYGF